jgi:hypothetical protein
MFGRITPSRSWAAVLLFVCATTAFAESTYHVASTGQDRTSQSGSKSEPFASVPYALQRTRQDASDLPVTILIREGVYRLPEPIELSPEDSGTPGAPVTIAAYPGEAPVLSGGTSISGWQQDGPLWVTTVDLSQLPLSSFNALWVDGELRTRARTPNDGYFQSTGTIAPLMPLGSPRDQNPKGFRFQPGDLENWAFTDDSLLVALHSWDVSYNRLAAIDTEQHIVRITEHPKWAFDFWGPRNRYYIENLREALDSPGEWFLDRDTARLWYWPMPGESPDTTEVIVPRLPHLLRFEGNLENDDFVEHIHIDGLHFQHTAFVIPPEGMESQQAAHFLPAAIQAEGARHCRITNCDISNISTYGIWFRRGCRRNLIQRNHLHALGGGGVRIGDDVNAADPSHESSWNRVDNNWIHDGGKLFPAGVGVWIGRSSYNTVSHNEISDLFYTGVSVGWSWGFQPSSAHHNTIEFNRIHHLGKGILSDMGGIYTLGIAPGTVLRNNVIHDVFSHYYGGNGIYPDEGSSDLLIENNLVYNTQSGNFQQHYGEMNRVVNNVFAFSHEDNIVRTKDEDTLSFVFERNIVYVVNGRLLGGNWGNDRFRMYNNCYWGGDNGFDFAGLELPDWQAKGYDIGSIVADPLFRDPEAFDFTLDHASPAFNLGFKAFDPAEAGLYGDDAWVNGPKAIAHPPSKLPTPIAELGLITKWKLIGPFDFAGGAGHDVPYPPETTLNYAAQHKGKDGKSIEWLDYDGKPWQAFVDLRHLIQPSDDAVAYAVCRIKSPVAQAVQLRSGSNDTLKIFLNGEEVLSANPPSGRTLELDSDVTPVTLPVGESTLLLKIGNQSNLWGFCLRITDQHGNPVSGLTNLTLTGP